MIGSTGVDLHSKLLVVQKKEKMFSSLLTVSEAIRTALKTRDVAISASWGWSQEAGKGIYWRLKTCKSHIH